MPNLIIPVTDEAYSMIQDHLRTIKKLSADGKTWVDAGMTVEEWVEQAFRLACEPIIGTSNQAAAVAARQQADTARRTAVDGFLFSRGAGGRGA